MSEKTSGKEMMEMLSYKKQNIYEKATPEEVKAIYDYADGYMQYLDAAKTEREAVTTSIEMAKNAGYTEYKIGDKIAVGDKKYYNNNGKSLILFRVGTNDIEKDGVRIIASHIDSPRLDLKQVP